MSLKAVIKFNTLMFDDFTSNNTYDHYTTQVCTCCNHKHSAILKGRTILEQDESQNECGISGCNRPAHYFVDFREHDYVFLDIIESEKESHKVSDSTTVRSARKRNYGYITSRV